MVAVFIQYLIKNPEFCSSGIFATSVVLLVIFFMSHFMGQTFTFYRYLQTQNKEIASPTKFAI